MQDEIDKRLNFEFPLVERVRSLLRIENLFIRFLEAQQQSDKAWAIHSALSCMFEIMDCASRAEFKMDLLQELERQKQVLQVVESDEEQQLLQKLENASLNLQSVQQKFGQSIRDNEWLMLVKQKMDISGGLTPVDFPSYYFWQNTPIDYRLDCIKQWSSTLMPTYDAISLLLAILRSHANLKPYLATKGAFQQEGLGKNIELVQIIVSISQKVIPEISANKYVTNIHFVENDFIHPRGRKTMRDIPFHFSVCSFS